MKTAVCISGQPRFGSFAFQGLVKNMLQSLDCDAFVFLWRLKGQSEDEARALAESHIGRHIPVRGWSILEQIDFPEKDYAKRMHAGSNIFNIQSMYYSMKMANQLKIDYEKTHGMRYDCAIRARVDASCLTPMDLTKYQPLLNDYMFVPDVPYFSGGLNDIFAFSSSENMDVMAGLYDRMDDYFYNDKVLFNPHVMLLHHLRKSQIPVAYLSAPVEIITEVSTAKVLEG